MVGYDAGLDAAGLEIDDNTSEQGKMTGVKGMSSTEV
jgi:hypothetical protein